MSEIANDLFIRATRKKFRFSSTRGHLSVEDLWDLSLEALDAIAISLDKEISSAGKSFISKKSSASKEAEFGLEVVKFVIETRIAEDVARRERAKVALQRQTFNGLLERRRLEEMENLPIEDLEKKIAELDAKEAELR